MFLWQSLMASFFDQRRIGLSSLKQWLSRDRGAGEQICEVLSIT